MKKKIGMSKIFVAALVFLIGGAMALPSNALTTNLVPNPSFETSYLPANVVHDYLFNQPVWPTGWLAEGATELFDHTPNAHHNGQYSAGISGSWSGPRTVCEPTCMAVPGGDQRDAAYQYYSLAPAWRTQDAIPVIGGVRYTFSSWIKLTIPKTQTGAVTKVRWVDASGVPIGWSAGPSLIANLPGSNYTNFVHDAQGPPVTFVTQTTPWTYKYATVTAPAAARGAILLLTYTDDAWNGSVDYDYVCFGTYQTTTGNDICRTTYSL